MEHDITPGSLSELSKRCTHLYYNSPLMNQSSHEFASQFGLALFIGEKHPKTIGETESPAHVFRQMNHRPITVNRLRPVEKGRQLRPRSITSDPSNSNNPTAITAVIAATDRAETSKKQQVKTETENKLFILSWLIITTGRYSSLRACNLKMYL